MNTKAISSWIGWKMEIERLRQEEAETRKERDTHVSDLLFRGQGRASWRLESSLERNGIPFPSIEEYGKTLDCTKSVFESCTGKIWGTHFKDQQELSPPRKYEFMVYLRHHGFPTPLLDWTRSPYVASFFAFRHPTPEAQVAIYSFREFLGLGKSSLEDEGHIVGCGPNIRTHQRHHMQQAEYTLCKKRNNGIWHYCSHEEVLSSGSEGQDLATKYTLPSDIRLEVLADLDAMNINAYSLFGSEEGLAEMMSNREYDYGCKKSAGERAGKD